MMVRVWAASLDCIRQLYAVAAGFKACVSHVVLYSQRSLSCCLLSALIMRSSLSLFNDALGEYNNSKAVIYVYLL